MTRPLASAVRPCPKHNVAAPAPLRDRANFARPDPPLNQITVAVVFGLDLYEFLFAPTVAAVFLLAMRAMIRLVLGDDFGSRKNIQHVFDGDHLPPRFFFAACFA